MGHTGLISLTVSYRLHIIQKAKNEKKFLLQDQLFFLLESLTR